MDETCNSEGIGWGASGGARGKEGAESARGRAWGYIDMSALMALSI